MYPFFLITLLSICSLTRAIPPILPGDPQQTGDASPETEVTINARLIAGEAMMDPSKLLFEISAEHPIPRATLSVAIGGRRYQKALSIGRSLATDFTMPDIPWSERITYQLSFPNGQLIRKGELRLTELMGQGAVNVSDVRMDRSSYHYGDNVVLNVLFEGRSQTPLRIEVRVRDENGALLFTDQRRLAAVRQESTEEFSLQLPQSGSASFCFEFLLFDDVTGKLFDSGEVELPLAKTKPKS